MARGGQFTRQWRLLQLIDRPQGITVGDAAGELRCTVRTVRRVLSRDALALLDAMRDTLGVRGLRAKLQPASEADDLRDAVRIFAVERMRRVDLQRRRFELPAGFDVERYLAGAWGIVRGDLVTVKVVFAEALARRLAPQRIPPAAIRRGTGPGRASRPREVSPTYPGTP